MARTLEYEIFSGGDRSMGNVWLGDKGKVDGDSQRVLAILKRQHFPGVSFQKGEQFLQKLGRILSNGYMHAKRVKD